VGPVMRDALFYQPEGWKKRASAFGAFGFSLPI
jgi:hypothetical protein